MGMRERERERDSKRQRAREQAVVAGTFKRGHVLAAGDDKADGAEQLKAGWGCIWFLTPLGFKVESPVTSSL